MIVVDAGIVATALADDGEDGRVARTWLRGDRLAAPESIDLEVTSVLRRHTSGGRITPERGDRALHDLIALPLMRVPPRPFLPRCWELRHNLTVYDATYVALAESLGARLVTTDARLAHAPGPRCEFDLVG